LIKWESFGAACLANHVAVRIDKRLREFGIQTGPEFERCIQREKLRISATLDAVSQLNRYFEEKPVPAVFIKIWNHFPDMGDDIDVVIPAGSDQFFDSFCTTFPVKEIKKDPISSFAGKVEFLFRDSGRVVEFHGGKLGLFGEFSDFCEPLFSAGAVNATYPVALRIPGAEDALLLSVIGRIYHHGFFRISDLLFAAKTLEDDNFNWDRVMTNAGKLGICEGVERYIEYCRCAFQNHAGLSLKNMCIPRYRPDRQADLRGENRMGDQRQSDRDESACPATGDSTSRAPSRLNMKIARNGRMVPRGFACAVLYLKKVLYDLSNNRWRSLIGCIALPLFFILWLLRRCNGLLLHVKESR
jgi:hypothetical protein